MSFANWKDDYLTGNETIDRQHRMIFERLDFFYLAIHEGKGSAVLSQIITDLLEYAREHFATEEELFAKHEYPHAAEHIEEHRMFRERVEAYFEDYAEGREVDSLAVFEFLRHWVDHHILRVDSRYLPYFRTLGLIK